MSSIRFGNRNLFLLPERQKIDALGNEFKINKGTLINRQAG